MLKRIIALLLIGLLAVGASGCDSGGLKEVEGRIYYEAPAMGEYSVEYNGRVYTTRGTPFCYGVENASFGEHIGKKLGDTESMGGTFPEGTSYHFLDTEQYLFDTDHILMAKVADEPLQYYLAVCYEGIEIKDGGDLLKPLFLRESCRQFFMIDEEDPEQMWSPQGLVEAECETFILAVEKAKVTDAPLKGEPLSFMMISYDSVVVSFELYENDVLVSLLNPDTPLQLEKSAATWVREILS